MPGTGRPAESVGRSPVTVGFLAGDFPWSAPPPRIGKLISTGVIARNMTRALSLAARVLPYVPPRAGAPEETHREAMAAFLRSIDILWADTYPGRSAEALAVRHALGLPCAAVLNAQGAVPKALEAMLFPWQAWLRTGDAILFTCRADRAIWKRLVDRSTLKEWVAPLPIDETLFYPRPEPERLAAREQLGMPLDAPLLLYVGRLNIQKNLHALLRLLAVVRRHVPAAHLCLVGAEDDVVLGEFGVSNDDYVAYLRALAAALGVGEAVRFAGPLFGEDLARAYAAADLLVNATFYHRENFGLSQAEAQACGTPVLCSHWGGFKDVVTPGETGFFMDTVLSKHGIWVEWLTGAHRAVNLLQDEALRARMRERAASHAGAHFTVPAVARTLRKLLAGLSDPRSEGGPGEAAGYEPSPFAREYEANKRACGWYDPTREHTPPGGYPPMFGGEAYALYERMMQPYATRLAGELPPDAIQPDWIPYCPAELVLDAAQQRARIEDRVWSWQRRLPPHEWELLRQIDGRTTVREIAAAIAPEGPAPDIPAVATALWNLHGDGFLLFQETAPHP